MRPTLKWPKDRKREKEAAEWAEINLQGCGTEEVMDFIEKHRFMGIGLGYIDMHLPASAILTGVPLWTLDKKLREISLKLGLLR